MIEQTPPEPAEPLLRLVGRIRPNSLRELMAGCLRSIRMGDPFTSPDGQPCPEVPQTLLDEVLVTEEIFGNIRCLVYRPKGSQGNAPLILYMHGGGFVVGCSEDTDYITRMLCHSNQAVVVSVNYRLAPKAMFPEALKDCQGVLASVQTESRRLGFDKDSIFFAGDSAGGNLALSLFHFIKTGKEAVRGLISLAPWLDMAVETYASYNNLAADGVIFDAPFIAYARAAYARFEQWRDPLVSPLYSKLSDLPATLLIMGTADPFIDQAVAFKGLADAGNCKQIEVSIYEGMPHCFYTFPSLFEEELDCFREISAFMTRALKTTIQR